MRQKDRKQLDFLACILPFKKTKKKIVFFLWITQYAKEMALSAGKRKKKKIFSQVSSDGLQV